MSKQLFSLTGLLLFSMAATGQIKFEPGYFIGNDGQRTECEIRNVDWSSNPTSFEYRMAGGQSQEASIDNISEFGLTGGSTFRRFTVDIDRSSDDISRLTKNRNPEFKKEVIFLRLLVAGKATLYGYEDKGLKRFFYQVDQSPIQQLVYKRYLESSERGWETGKAAANDQYKQQLFNDLKCADITQKDLEGLTYDRNRLMKLFTRFNECSGVVVATNESTKKTSEVHLTLRPGVAFNSFTINDGTTETKFESAAAFRFGFEVETVLPFNKGLWAVTFEPAYQSFSSKVSSGITTIDYKSIDLGIALRRYLFKDENGGMYVNLGFVYAMPISGKEAIKAGSVPVLEVSTGVNLNAGLGYRKGKFSAEVNYGFARGILGNYSNYNSSYSGPALILGYRLK